MKIRELLERIELPKNTWEVLVSDEDKLELGQELVSLVQNAYSVTPRGSMVNRLRDVVPSGWNVYDWDEQPGVDACVFFRTARPHESWIGHKIQGIGHDGKRHSKDSSIKRLEKLLARTGWWIESSDAMRSVLLRTMLIPVTDERLLQQLFPDSELRMISEDTYVRKLVNGEEITESVFGNPRLKGEHN
jgi:hypothetical protein